ncbi:MAG: prolipoprotein diacylglyceryl transferase [Kiritimatiellaeota bacterium]|nr:prolipoprotein diacylglyceryl transferase [Kiritimatiellota bacterium]
MNPIAFQLGPLTIRWYGIMVAAGFLLGFTVLQRRAGRGGAVSRDEAGNLALTAMLGGIVGARLFYVIENWEEYRRALAEILRIDHGGLVFYGGLFGAVAAVWLRCRRKRLPVWEVGDLFAPALPVGHALGRVGCFLNGCCFGRPWRGLFSVLYPPGSDVHHVQRIKGICAPDSAQCLPVFPIQLMAAVMNLAIFGILLLAGPRLARRGQLFALYVMLYSSMRFFLEFARGDYLVYIGPFTPAQVVCLLLFPVGVVLFVLLGRFAPDRRAAPSLGGDEGDA